MKRSVAILLALLLLFTMFTACSNNPEDVQSAAPSDTGNASSGISGSSQGEGAEAVPPEERSVYPLDGNPKISVWKSLAPEFFNYFDDIEETIGYKAHCEATGVVVEYSLIPRMNATESATVILASGDCPDIMDAIESHYTPGLAPLYTQGILIELTDIVEQYMPNYAATLRLRDDYTRDTMTDDGLLLGIYNLWDEGFPVTMGPTVRGDWLEDLNMDIPVTYDDCFNMLKAFKVEKGADAAMWVTAAGVPYYDLMAAGYGISAYYNGTRYQQFYNVDGVVKFGPLEDGWIEFMAMMQAWYGEGLIYKDFMTQTSPNDVIRELMATDRCGLAYPWSFLLTSIPGMSDDPDFTLTPIGDAVKNEGDKLHLRGLTNLVEQCGTIITSSCKNVEAAARWLDYGFTAEGLVLSNYGIEGESFDYVNGEVVFKDFILNDPLGYQVTVVSGQYRSISTTVSDWRTDSTNPIQLTAGEVWRDTSDNDWRMPARITMTEAESDEFALLWADISTLIEEYQVGLILGERSVDEFETFKTLIETQGIGRCIELKQAALDRYNNR